MAEPQLAADPRRALGGAQGPAELLHLGAEGPERCQRLLQPLGTRGGLLPFPLDPRARPAVPPVPAGGQRLQQLGRAALGCRRRMWGSDGMSGGTRRYQSILLLTGGPGGPGGPVSPRGPRAPCKSRGLSITVPTVGNGEGWDPPPPISRSTHRGAFGTLLAQRTLWGGERCWMRTPLQHPMTPQWGLGSPLPHTARGDTHQEPGGARGSGGPRGSSQALWVRGSITAVLKGGPGPCVPPFPHSPQAWG